MQLFGRYAKLENGIYIIRDHLNKGRWDSDDFYDVSDEEGKKLADLWNKITVDYISLQRVPTMVPMRLLV